MTERMEILEKMQNYDTKIEETIENKVKEYMQEAEEKNKRKLNIVIVSLPESGKESADDRKNDDRDRVRELVRKIPEVDAGEVDNQVRLGAFKIGQNVRPRLLRMEVKTEATKQKIMKGIYSLNANKPQAQRIYINHDNTPKERDQIKHLREELKIRKEAGEVNLGIDFRTLKIVNRQARPVDAAAATKGAPVAEAGTH